MIQRGIEARVPRIVTRLSSQRAFSVMDKKSMTTNSMTTHAQTGTRIIMLHP
jgi:hypothetical protein